MTTRRIIYTRADGGVSIIVPAPQARLPDETEDAFIDRVRAAHVPDDAVGVAVIEAADLPPDRTFRNAWRKGAALVDVDMDHAREIVRGHIRVARAPKLASLDTAYARADEVGDVAEKRRVSARKQALRDAPADARLTAAQTPETLKPAMDAILSEIAGA